MAKKTLKRGIFITFEGPERSGKSTHSRLAADFLKRRGYSVVYTREPGGTAVGDRIRGVLLDAKNIRMSALAEALLFEASRSELVREVIAPALSKKKIVISDRFHDATCVYQGYAGGVPLKDIKKIESVSMKNVRPDLTILLDIDAKTGLAKIRRGKRDRMESKNISFHRKVRAGYLALAAKDKKRIKLIRTKSTIEATFKEVKNEVMNVIERHKRSGSCL